MSFYGDDMRMTLEGPLGALVLTNVYAATATYIETDNRGNNFLVVESGAKKQRVNCGSVGDAEKFLREASSTIRKTQQSWHLVSE
jgi:hypothetical protein